MDIKQILQVVDLQNLAEQAGARFNNRHSSRCPLHNGNNPTAFHIYYGQDGVARYHCFTNCPDGANGGNAIDFYMRWRQVDFTTAIKELAVMYNINAPTQLLVNANMTKPADIDPAPSPPSDKWQARAAAFVRYAHDKLWNDKRAMCYLAGRGLIEATIATFSLGYNPRDLHDTVEHWGLDGKPVWLPCGIVIPHRRYLATDCSDGYWPIWFVNIRRPVGNPKYCGPRGGVRGIYHGPIAGHPVLLLAEGEFDTMLAWQSANDLCDVMTLGGARHRIDVLDSYTLMRYAAIVATYDLDAAGERGSEYLRSAVGARITVDHPSAHDLTDYWKSGGDLRRWIAANVVEQMEPLIQSLDEYQQPELFCKWLSVYQRALDAK
jgi:DNA primase